MFPFLKYLETSVKNRSAGILGQETKRPECSGAAFPPPDRGGEPSAKSAENPIHGVEDAGDALDTPVVETTGFLRTGLACTRVLGQSTEASHF